MVSKPLISVIMPVYNAEKFIGRAIDSVLKQTFKDFELIILNDKSSDSTLEIIKKYLEIDSRIRLITFDTKSTVATLLNKGVEVAKSNIIARMDADDYSLKTRFEKQYKKINENDKYAIVGANIIIVDEDYLTISSRSYPTNSKDLKKMMLRYSPFAHPVVMFRKDYFQEFNGYNANIPHVEDIDLWFRLGTKYEFASIDEPLLKYTLLFNSNSHKNVKRQELEGFEVKWRAVTKYGYKPSFYDISYNVLQYLTFWIMPPKFRVNLYNALRSRNII
jgi:glycosyltransferase involved in cell wall biosynthesis